MKCIRNLTTQEIRRVADTQAKYMVEELKGWEYIKKQVWKAEKRVNAVSEAVSTPVVVDKSVEKAAKAEKQEKYLKTRKERTNN